MFYLYGDLAFATPCRKGLETSAHYFDDDLGPTVRTALLAILSNSCLNAIPQDFALNPAKMVSLPPRRVRSDGEIERFAE